MKLLVVGVFRQNFAFKPNIDFNVERKSSLVIMTHAHIKVCIGVVDFRFNFVNHKQHKSSMFVQFYHINFL